MEVMRGNFEAAAWGEGDGNGGSEKVGGGVSWASPRISFSRDFVMSVSERESSCSHGMMIGRLSPEKRKWEQASEEDISGEFEFRMADLNRGNGDQGDEVMMLSADELFFDGKLRPLHLPRDRPLARDDLCLKAWTAPHYKHLSLSRHLSFDMPHCSALAQPLSLENEKSQRSPPSKPALPFTSNPASPRASSKYSSKIKEFFKNKKVLLQVSKETSCAQLTRDNSVTSTCRLPISPRSFWPFSRSNSAGESQTATSAVPDLPPRSNSAGESKSTGCVSSTSARADSVVQKWSCGASSDSTGLSRLQDNSNGASLPSQSSQQMKYGMARSSPSLPSGCMQGSFNSEIRSETSTFIPLASLAKDESRIQEDEVAIKVAGSVGEKVSANLSSEQSSNHIKVPDEHKTSLLQTSTPLRNPSKSRGPCNHGRTLRGGVCSPARNLSRGSPGRRVVLNSPGAKGGTGKIMLRNLERCKAGPNIGVGRSQDLRTRSDGRGDSYPVTVRVSPVLNVAIYRRTSSSKTRLFSFRKLFSSRKLKPVDATINNWRNGA